MARTDPKRLRQAARDIREFHGFTVTRTGVDIPAALDDAAHDLIEANALIGVLKDELGKAHLCRYELGNGVRQIQAAEVVVDLCSEREQGI